MLLQEIDLVSIPLTVFLLIFLMIFMIVLYIKVRRFLLILIIFLFSLILGINSLSVDIPLSPYFQILFILFQSCFFLITSIELYTKIKKGI